MPTPTPNKSHQQVVQYVSPLADILLVERRSATTGFGEWEYGQPHPEERYKHLELILVAPADDPDYVNAYWAAPREDQDSYNYETTYPYFGLPTFQRFTHTYLEKRATYTPLDKGSRHPLDLEDETPHKFTGAKLVHEVQKRLGEQQFDNLYVLVQRTYDKLPTPPAQESHNAEIDYPYQGSLAFPRYIRRYVIPRNEYEPLALGTADPVHAESILISEKVTRFDDELNDALYVLVTRVYDKVPQLADSDDLAALATFGYQIDRPHGGSAYPRLTWRFPIQLADYSAATDASVCPIPGYDGDGLGLVLIDEQLDPDPNSTVSAFVTRVYDKLDGPTLAETTKMLNADVPDKFVILRTTTQSRSRINTGSIDTPSGLPTAVGGAVLQTQYGPDGSSTIVETKGSVRTEVTVGPLSGWEFDGETGQMLNFTQELVPAGTAPSALNSSAEYGEISPYNSAWSVKTSRKSTGLAGMTRNYQRIINYTWPPILVSLTFDSVSAIDPASGQSYTLKKTWYPNLIEAYSGPCRATVTEQWSLNPVSLSVPTQMLPRAMSADLVFSKLRIPPCLHAFYEITEAVGPSHPKLAEQSITITFPATNFTTWPATIVVDVDQIPYEGGYKIVTTTLQRPVIA